MNTEFYWTFRIETSRFGGVMGSSCTDYVTEENMEAWQRFVEKRIREVMKPETMDLQEFKDCLEEVQKEKEWRETQKVRAEQLRIKAADDRHRRSSMERLKVAYIPKGLTVDYEKEYGRLIRQEVTFVPAIEDDFLYQLRFLERWYKKSVPQLIELKRPDAAFAGRGTLPSVAGLRLPQGHRGISETEEAKIEKTHRRGFHCSCGFSEGME